MPEYRVEHFKGSGSDGSDRWKIVNSTGLVVGSYTTPELAQAALKHYNKEIGNKPPHLYKHLYKVEYHNQEPNTWAVVNSDGEVVGRYSTPEIAGQVCNHYNQQVFNKETEPQPQAKDNSPSKHPEHRTKLPTSRRGKTFSGKAGGYKYYITVNFYEEPSSNKPGEVFIVIAKEGSELRGLFDALAVTISVALQYNVPWEILREKYLHTRFGSVDPSILHHITESIDSLIREQDAEVKAITE